MNKRMEMLFWGGKPKALTLSYDDGVVQDIRFIEIINKYGLKGTFNINSGLYRDEDAVREKYDGRMKISEAKELYINSGHEVAVHAFTHPFLNGMTTSEIVYEITKDRESIEEEYGVIARGMAYPFGTYNSKVIDAIEKCDIAYSRTTKSTYAFNLPDNWLEFHPTCHHNYENLSELIKKFVETHNKWGRAEMFYLWGHTYEFDDDDNWDVIEKFAQYAGGHEHIWYATNIEIYNYVQAYKNLHTSFDRKIIYNPSCTDVWFTYGGKVYVVKAGETIKL